MTYHLVPQISVNVEHFQAQLPCSVVPASCQHLPAAIFVSESQCMEPH